MTVEETVQNRDITARLFAGPGEVRALARTLDWGATPLGWPDAWSPALRIATAAMLDARHPVCLWSGPEYALVYNDAYRRILAAKHPAALGRPGSIVWAEIWSELAAQFAGVSAGGPAVYGEDARFVMARLEGGETEVAWFSYSLSALRDEDGQVVAIFNISPETTGRVRAEQALAAERERLRGVVLQAPVPMALHDGPEHRYTLVNDAYRRVSGGRDVTGLTLRDAFPEVVSQGVPEIFDHVYASGESWSGPETHLHYDRSGTGPEDAWFDLRYDPIFDEEGRVTGILNFSIDVTDQVLARREVERLLAESEAARLESDAANLAKSQFLGAMSHELRTPLNAIAGYLELLELGIRGSVTEEQRTDLARMRRANEHMIGLISDILNFARLEAGQLAMQTHDVDIADVVGEVEPLVARQMAEKRITFTHGACATDTPGARHVVRADSERLRQVLLNLLTNAIKFTNPDGRIALECETDAASGMVCIRVRDTGRGIPPEALSRIFEPFVQLDRHLTTTSLQGVGLGLSISHDLIGAMGGELTVESTVGEGSTFTLTLPRA